jgi:lipoprotein-anchoring transpeptidase ErfK/SrfK
MRNHALRASWVATVVATALALASSMATAPVGPAAAQQVRSRQQGVQASRAFTDAALVQAVGATEATAPRARVPAAPRPEAPAQAMLVRVARDLPVLADPHSGARVVGTVPSASKYYDVPITAWVEDVSRDGRWGRVEIPYVWPRRHGWIALRGLSRRTTDVEVHVDLSDRRITVSKSGRVRFTMPAAIGSATSPTPPGEYFVTDRIAFSGGYLGTFAFGISGIQPKLPPGWSGGNQLAIHGTNNPSSIGTPASAGCLRVSERSLDRLKPLLRLGTPVIVVR